MWFSTHLPVSLAGGSRCRPVQQGVERPALCRFGDIWQSAGTVGLEAERTWLSEQLSNGFELA